MSESSELREELAFAVELARRGGALAMEHFRRGVTPEEKDGGEPVSIADREVNALLVEAIRSRYPEDAVLAEESPPDPARFSAHRTWMVDPIDGTRAFLAGSDRWEVMIGLVVAGTPTLATILNAVHGTLFEATRGAGAFVTERGVRRRIRLSSRTWPPRLAVRSARDGEIARRMGEALGATEIIEKESLGANAVLIVETEADIALSVSGSPREWDTCAIDVVLDESGGGIMNCLGEPMTYLKTDPTQPHGLVMGPTSVLERSIDAVSRVYRERRRSEP